MANIKVYLQFDFVNHERVSSAVIRLIYIELIYPLNNPIILYQIKDDVYWNLYS